MGSVLHLCWGFSRCILSPLQPTGLANHLARGQSKVCSKNYVAEIKCCIVEKKETLKYIYENLFFFFFLLSQNRGEIRWAKSESGTAKIYTRLRYDIFRESYFFALPAQGWHRADLKHLFILPAQSGLNLQPPDDCLFRPRVLQASGTIQAITITPRGHPKYISCYG